MNLPYYMHEYTISYYHNLYLSWEDDESALVLLQSEDISLETLLRSVFPPVINCNADGQCLLLVDTSSLTGATALKKIN